jgi:hypothetical protein
VCVCVREREAHHLSEVWRGERVCVPFFIIIVVVVVVVVVNVRCRQKK